MKIIYNIKNFLQCDYYNITFIDTTNPYDDYHSINTLYDYSSEIIYSSSQ